jgi:transcriptional regulator with XRE-family HTH domain
LHVLQANSNKIVAAAVRRFRHERAWSQEEFAAKCKLHRTYVGAIERGECNITLHTLDQLARALKVLPIELMKEE